MKSKIKIKEFTDWVCMAEKENEEKFEEKHKKGLNITRIGGFILMICCIPLLRLFVKGVVDPTFWKFSSIVCFLISAFFLFILFVVYKAWIKSFWNFLKKDSIVHYIFLAIIPAAIIFVGYQYVFVKSAHKAPPMGGNQVQTQNTLKNDYDEIIDRLNGFYSTLFAAITVIAAILAIGAWRTVKELREKLESYKKIESDVEFLKKKKDLAEWVQDKFEKDIDKKILTSISFELNEDDRKKLKEIEKQILNETTDDSWLKLVYAKQLLEKIQKNKTTEEDEFIKIEKIFDYIEKRDLLKEDSEILELVFHFKALMYWFWYDNRKFDFIRKNESPEKKIPWVKKWWKEDEGEDKNKEKKEDLIEGEKENKRIALLTKSKEYYEKALTIYKEKEKESNPDETRGNLALVLIELSKFKDLKTDRESLLKNAKENLDKVIEITFNTHWDKARTLYYIDPVTNKAEIDELLARARNEIVDKKDKKFFNDRIENEQKEIGLDGNPGFPGIGKQNTIAYGKKRRIRKNDGA